MSELSSLNHCIDCLRTADYHRHRSESLLDYLSPRESHRCCVWLCGFVWRLRRMHPIGSGGTSASSCWRRDADIRGFTQLRPRYHHA